ncbi:MAG TPA: hypothetical protein VM840_01350 [Actinomycetota bacterium]|nr:hypothetical protein [Actinomycetota bacterium]
MERGNESPAAEELDAKLDEASDAVDEQMQQDGGTPDTIERSHEMPADGQVAEGGDGRGVTAVQDQGGPDGEEG